MLVTLCSYWGGTDREVACMKEGRFWWVQGVKRDTYNTPILISLQRLAVTLDVKEI
jgi:hypothetical protein